MWVVGHRGAMGHCPENTLASFERGLELGADWIELDVHLSRDDALVVIHDETVDRTTNGHGAVRDHTLAELKALDAGGWFGPEYAGQRIPTLDEVLAWARQRDTIVDIEIKNAPVYYAGIEAAAVTDGVLVRSALEAYEPAPGSSASAADDGGLLLVATRTMYDQGVGLQHSPSSAHLAPGASLRLNPADFGKLGLPRGATVRITSSRGSIDAPAIGDGGVPEGSAAMVFNQANASVAALIDASARVTGVRVERP